MVYPKETRPAEIVEKSKVEEECGPPYIYIICYKIDYYL